MSKATWITKTQTQTENKAWGKIHSTLFSSFRSLSPISFQLSALGRSRRFVPAIAISLCNSSDRQKCANVSIQQEIRTKRGGEIFGAAGEKGCEVDSDNAARASKTSRTKQNEARFPFHGTSKRWCVKKAKQKGQRKLMKSSGVIFIFLLFILLLLHARFHLTPCRTCRDFY